MRSIQIRSFSGTYFPVFGLNTGKYGPEKIPSSDTFHAVFAAQKLSGSYLGFESNFRFFASGLLLASGEKSGPGATQPILVSKLPLKLGGRSQTIV